MKPPPDRLFVILGAGASSEAGAPLMKDFVNTARDLFQDRQGRVSSVFTAMAALARSQAKATLDLQNIEEVFSAFELASLVQRLGNLPEDIHQGSRERCPRVDSQDT